MNAARLVLFDIDGTLLSAGAVSRAALVDALSEPDASLGDFSDAEPAVAAILG